VPTKKIIDGYNEFIEEFKENEKLFLELAEEGQHPKVFWIGCCDSRVTPSLVTHTDPGELFILRNIANIFPPKEANDSCTASALEFAVHELKVEHIVICGHTQCGGMIALTHREHLDQDSSVISWLDHAEPARVKLVKEKGPEKVDVTDLIKENIILQAEHIRTFNFIRELEKKGKLKIHKWLYNISTGHISVFNPVAKKWVELDKCEFV